MSGETSSLKYPKQKIAGTDRRHTAERRTEYPFLDFVAHLCKVSDVSGANSTGPEKQIERT